MENLPQTNSIASKLQKYSVFLHFFSLFLIFVLVIFVISNTQRIEDLTNELNDNYVTRMQYENFIEDVPFDPNYSIDRPNYNDSPDSSPVMSYEPVSYSGVIMKERIPEEYELGDYWYNFYFDEPQLIETVAGKMKLSYVQIQASTIDSLDEYLDMDVVVVGRLGYGYAESRVILVDKVIVN